MAKWVSTTSDPSGESLLVIEGGEAWRPTLGLRWLERGEDRALQQLWEGRGGAREWRDVPTESEPSDV